MGNVPSINRDCLPKPTSETLLASLPFEWGSAVHDNCHKVIMPDNWYLKDSAFRRDLIDLDIIDPEGNIIAHVTGKNTDYDFHARIHEVRGQKIDMEKVTIRDGYLYDTEAFLTSKLRKYRMYCTSVNGYPHLQEECDGKYAALKAEYEKAGEEIPIKAIKLGADLEEGAAAALNGASL